MKKIIVTVCVLLVLFSLPARAELYDEQYEKSGAEALYDALPQETKELLDNLQISPKDSTWVNKITTSNIFTVIIDIIKENGKTPFLTAVAVLGIVLLVAALKSFGGKPESNVLMSYIATIAVAGASLLPLYNVITATARTVKAGAQFMLSFVPVYCTVLLSSGKPMTSTVSGTLLLGASEGLIALATYIITPLSVAYLAVCMCGSLSPVINISGLSEIYKRAATWSLSLIMTVYIGVLSIQTTVNAAADNLALKTGKFMVGSFIPVVGTAVSEAVSTVGACVSLLKSSIGIYGIVAEALIVIPMVLWIIVWRFSLSVSSSVATLFDCKEITALLRAADTAVSFLLCVLLICSLAFILSLTVLMLAGG